MSSGRPKMLVIVASYWVFLACCMGLVIVEACPSSPWAPEFGLNHRVDEINPSESCSSLTTRFSCRFRNFCCFENDQCFPANPTFVECPTVTTKDLCMKGGCFWDGNVCRRVCPFTSNPTLLCSVLGQVYQPPTAEPTNAPSTGKPTNKPTKLPSSRAPVSRTPTQSPIFATVKPTSATKSPTISTTRPTKALPTPEPSRATLKPVISRTNNPSSSTVNPSPKLTDLPSGPTIRPTPSLRPTLKSDQPTPGPTTRPTSNRPSRSPTTGQPIKRVTSSPTPGIKATASPRSTDIPTMRPSQTPSEATASPSRPTNYPIRQPSYLTTNRPTFPVGWSPGTGLPRGGVETDPDSICSSFTNQNQCSGFNFCCWDDGVQECFPPAQTMHDLECPAIKDREACATVFGNDCVWSIKNRCQRREPPISELLTANDICVAVQKSRLADAELRGVDNAFCFVKTLLKPCVFPFTNNGKRFESCASMTSDPPDASRGRTSTFPFSNTWCPVVPDAQTSASATNGWGYCSCTPKKRARSVLMVIADDLRTDLSAAYGRKDAKTPFIDDLVNKDGTVIFDRAYSNYPVCGPSRDSFLSGLLPDSTKIYNFAGDGLKTDSAFRSRIKTIPEVFRDAGFYTLGGGKVFHLGHNDPQSWDQYYFENVEQNADCAKDKLAEPLKERNGAKVVYACRTTAPIDSLLDYRVVNSATDALQTAVMRGQEPFFMAVGLYKPHTPYHVHARFWNQYALYGTEDAERTQGPQPRSSYKYSDLTFNVDSDILNSWGSNPWNSKVSDFRRIMRTGYLAATTQMDDALGRVLVTMEKLRLDQSVMVVLFGDHGYYLGENNLFAKNSNFELAVRVPMIFNVPWLRPPRTPIVFQGEARRLVNASRGMRQLNDDDVVSSDSEQEDETESPDLASLGAADVATQLLSSLSQTSKNKPKSKPLLVSFSSEDMAKFGDYVAPDSMRTRGFFELIDMMPTLTGLMGVGIPRDIINGTDQSRLIYSSALRGTTSGISSPRSFAYSQVNRCNAADCSYTPNTRLWAAGYSIRTDRWRYTVFVTAPGGTPLWNTTVLSEELYTHDQDESTLFAYQTGSSYDTEFLNVAAANPSVCSEMLELIRARFDVSRRA